MKRLFGALTGCATILLAAGLALRMTGLRDRVQAFAAIFYATPWPVLAALALGLAIVALQRRRRCRALVFTLLFAATFTTWLRHSFRSEMPLEATPTLRLVYWNAARPTRNLPGRVDYLRSLQADVYAVGESNVYSDTFPAEWRAGFPGRTLTQRRGGLLLITPEAPTSSETGRLNDRGDYALVRCMVKGRALTLLLVDFDSRPTQSRAPAFARVAELIAAHRDEPLIVLGDFNTPRESAHFDPFRAQFRHAFETAGSGFAETWPVPLPVLSLDHIWLGGPWRAVSCHLGWSVESDHRAVIVDLPLN